MKKIIEIFNKFISVKNPPKNRLILIVLLVVTVILAVVLHLSYKSFYNQDSDLEKMMASQEVINDTEKLMHTILLNEATRVAYTHNKQKDSIDYQNVENLIDTIALRVVTDPYQTVNITALGELVTDRWEKIKQNQSLKKNTLTDSVYVVKIKETAAQLAELETLKMNNFRRAAIEQQKRSLYLNIVSVSIALLFGIVSLFIFFRDREERLKVESNLTELNLNKDKFFSIISHDLRGPTSNIVRLSEFLLEPNLAETDQKSMTLHLHKAAQNLQKLLENLLSWAKFQMGRLDFMPAPVDLYNLTNESVAQIATMAADKAIVIKNQVSPRTYAFADDQMIMMVLRNLLVNAIKFTNQSGTVKIQAKETPDQVEISVIDNGIGMDADTTDKLFQLGNHFTTLGTSNEKGSGLGLILCMELLEKNNGTIRVTSEQGKGSIFTFSLPKLGR
ncbi:HAMP domain-containing sensor histidine kinase [Cytophagaceae bacterium DM2B3-1]|uniref:histidine kinase n=1 Tax=Xanthocytophaga flava TaxID=3048013 RepID=A0ABT7CRN0_9BACT|nr:HAMP domain-containing sensor histidine kinase [Xanthocytophaga flavus]MDJ1468608.1 HAMP domain-containing sensor histidine kinase [Xanthocytophaga flavus]MDJ1496388.1 HAMP domain-containing sensor histidine kinase [Xanthocytophaga flavus]